MFAYSRVALVLLFPLVLATPVRGQYFEEGTIQASEQVLQDTMTTPGHQIPQAMLQDAHGVAIIPNVVKGSFVVGARHGRGVLFLKDQAGIWHAPVFVTLTGGNVGWQVGVQASDIILVFKTVRSVQGILSGKLTLGADAAAAAGPVGRQAAAATDGALQAEIYTYSRSRGLFAGVSIDGSVVRIDRFATGAYYRSPGPGQPVVVPASADRLTQKVASYAGQAASAAPASSGTPPSPVQQHHQATDADVLRSQLVQLAPQLYEILDPQWKTYLALPGSLFLGGSHPEPSALNESIRRFEAVSGSTQYQALAARPEFQSVYGVLRHYQQSLVAGANQLQLPPPPTKTAWVPR